MAGWFVPPTFRANWIFPHLAYTTILIFSHVICTHVDRLVFLFFFYLYLLGAGGKWGFFFYLVR